MATSFGAKAIRKFQFIGWISRFQCSKSYRLRVLASIEKGDNVQPFKTACHCYASPRNTERAWGRALHAPLRSPATVAEHGRSMGCANRVFLFQAPVGVFAFLLGSRRGLFRVAVRVPVEREQEVIIEIDPTVAVDVGGGVMGVPGAGQDEVIEHVAGV